MTWEREDGHRESWAGSRGHVGLLTPHPGGPVLQKDNGEFLVCFSRGQSVHPGPVPSLISW